MADGILPETSRGRGGGELKKVSRLLGEGSSWLREILK